MNTVWKVLTRKKTLDPVATEQTELGRVLNTFDLTALGVGSTLGVGVYVLAGHVAKDTAGPAVVLSFLIASVASVFAGLCYAEFGARAPRAGSAYIYSYVCVGEFIAFVIGWNLILEYVIGSASVARGLSNYLDTLINDTLKNTFIDIAPIHVNYMSEYFDFFAFGVSVILAVALAFGMKESSIVNNVVTLLNLSVVLFVIIAGSLRADGKNWNLEPPANRTHVGTGGFFPFGVEGMIKGAATCFYGFVGFDCIATTGEEVRNPKRAIPFSIVLSLFIIFLAYFGTSTVVTLMVPYYDQDPNAPIPHAFEVIGWEIPKWIVAIGGIFGLCASLFGAMFPLPRIIYAMASDRLVFHFLSRVSPRFKTPVVGTLLAGLLTGLMAALFDLKQLVNMMSIGTLLAYTIVAASVLLLRYESDKGDVYEPLRTISDEDYDTYTDSGPLDEPGASEETELVPSLEDSGVLKQIFNINRQDRPTEISEKIVKVNVCLFCVLCILIGLCAMYLKKPIAQGLIWAIVLTAVVICVAVLVVMSIATQPKSRKELSFKVPLVPLVPALSILINIYLMLMLDVHTWIRFAVWMAVGIPAYYFSVRTHSDARNESISSKMQVPNGKLNGFANHGFVQDGVDEINEKYTTTEPLPQKIESTIAVLDEILEKEEAAIAIDRKYSVDTMSNASVSREENVEAVVHCADVPLTPVSEAPPLLESSDVVVSSSSLSNDVVVSPAEILPSVANSDVPPSPNVAESESIQMSEIPPPTETKNISEPSADESGGGSEISPPVVNETEEEEEEEEVATIVVPPPLHPFLLDMKENEHVSIPRPKFQISDVKLRHVEEKSPETPPADYSRQNSEMPDSDSGENLKFGTPEHKEFLEKLTQKLQQGYVPTVVTVNLSKKPSLKKQIPNVPNEDVIEDSIDRDDAKEKLAQHLAKTSNFALIARPNGNGNDNDKLSNEENNVESKPVEDKESTNSSDIDYKEKHRRNMQDIFGSIKLRKEDSFKVKDNGVVQKDNHKEIEDSVKDNDVVQKDNHQEIEPKVEKADDRLQHRQNMEDIFKSIRLRKVDSFKAQQ